MKKLLIVLGLLVCASALAKDRRLAAPPLSQIARALIRERMANHSKQMTELVWAVVLLDFPGTASLAQALALEPRISRPTTGDATELSAALAPRFFDLQDQLRDRARRLESVARTRDATGVARAYGNLAETCVTCHDAYLNGK